MCTADAGCAAVYDWGCAGNTLGLCRINYRQRPSTKPPLSCLHHKYGNILVYILLTHVILL